MPEDLSRSAVVLVGFLLLACQQVLTMEPHDVQEKQVSQTKRRLSLQSTGEHTAATAGPPPLLLLEVLLEF